MVQLHGGTITVDSVVHIGSHFHVSLPLTPEEAGGKLPEAPVAPAKTKPDEPELLSHAPLVLVAEDNPANVALIQYFARMRGCRTALASNGIEAVAYARAMRPDIILMDVNMPEMDGLEATRRITRDPRTRHIPIVCVTANAMAEDRESCLAAGAAAYLSKPVNLQELASTIARLLQAAKSEPTLTASR
jgi:CheY-like chemotaxis protein